MIEQDTRASIGECCVCLTNQLNNTADADDCHSPLGRPSQRGREFAGRCMSGAIAAGQEVLMGR